MTTLKTVFGGALGTSLATGVLFMALWSVGCGGSSSLGTVAAPTAASSGSPAQAEYIAHVDAICRSLAVKQQPVLADVDQALASKNLPGLTEAFNKVRAFEKSMLAAYSSAPVPTGDEEEIRKIVQAGAQFRRANVGVFHFVEGGLKMYLAGQGASMAGKDITDKLRLLLLSTTARYHKLGSSYGFKDCVGSVAG